MHLFGFAPPAANLFVGGKNESQKRGGGNYCIAQYISLGLFGLVRLVQDI